MSSNNKKLSADSQNQNSLTCQNRGESLKTKPRFATSVVVPIAIYNMRVAID